eukprot:6196039-Pleurochrysis_carterae.AAC.5
MEPEELDNQYTYMQITRCHEEGFSGQSLRSCYQCGSEGMHHHMNAVSKPELEKASAVPSSSSTLCAVCAGVLTLDQVTLIESDQAAAKLATNESSGAKEAAATSATPTADLSERTAVTEQDLHQAAASVAEVATSIAEQHEAEPLNSATVSTSDQLGDVQLTQRAGADIPFSASMPEPDGIGWKGANSAESGQQLVSSDDSAVPINSAESAPANSMENAGMNDSAKHVDSNYDDQAQASEVDNDALFGLRVRYMRGSGVPFPATDSARTFRLSENEDTHVGATRSVLLGRKGALNLAAGFLQSGSSADSKATALGWEDFEKYSPAPYETSLTRYAEPPLKTAIQYDSPVTVKPPFVSLSGGKVGEDPPVPFSARVKSLLLGGV